MMRIRRITFVTALLGAYVAVLIASTTAHAASPSPGPSFPAPEAGRTVYDYAEVLKPSTILIAEQIIDAIEARSGAEVAVFLQIEPGVLDDGSARRAATSLMNEWGVGRRRYNDGLVMFFDFEATKQHGQMWIATGDGARFYLSEDELSKAAQDIVLGYSKQLDFDSAVLAGLAYIDSQVTASDTAALEASVNGAVETANAAAGTSTVSLWVSIVAALGGFTSAFVALRNRNAWLHPLYATVMTAVSGAAAEIARATPQRAPDMSRLVSADLAEQFRTSISVVGGDDMRLAFERFLDLQNEFIEATQETDLDLDDMRARGSAIASQRDDLAKVARRDLRGMWWRRKVTQATQRDSENQGDGSRVT